MRSFAIKIFLVVLVGLGSACGSTTRPTTPPSPPSPATIETASAPVTASRVTPVNELPPTPTSIPPLGNYPGPTPIAPPPGYPAPLPQIPSPTPSPVIAPTITAAPNAISPENTTQLHPVARLTPIKREDMVGFIGNSDSFSGILDVAFTSDGDRVAVAKGDGILVYDLTTLRPFGYIDTGSVIPFKIFFLTDNKTLVTSSDISYWPLGATFFDSEAGQRVGMIRVPSPVKPEESTVARLSPDGRVVAIRQANYARLYDAVTRQPLASWPDWFPAADVVFSPDGRLAAIPHRGVAVWEVTSGRLLFTPTPRNTSAVLGPLAAFSPDGNSLATTDGHILSVWEVAGARKVFETTFPLQGIGFGSEGLMFAPNGRTIVLVTDNQVTAWRASDGQQIFTTYGQSVIFSPDSTLLVAADASREAVVSAWDVATGHMRFTIKGSSPQFAPNSRLLIKTTGGDFAFVDTAIGTIQSGFTARRPHFLPDGRLLDVLDDGSIRILDSTNGQTLATLSLRATLGPATSVAFLPDGRLAVASANATIRLYPPSFVNPNANPIVGEQGAWIYQVTVAPDGKTIASASKDGSVTFSDYPPRQFGGPPGEFTSVAVAPNGLWVAAGSSDGTVKLWPTTAPIITPTQTLAGHTNWVWSVAISPDGKQIASASADRTVRLWDAQSGSALLTLTGHTGAVHSVAYSPDGSILVSGAWDGTLKLWDAHHGALLRTLTGHTDKVNQVIFSRDGQVIASASSDGTVHLWDTATGRDIVTLNPGGGKVWSVAFSADGRQLAAALNDGTVQVWEAP